MKRALILSILLLLFLSSPSFAQESTNSAQARVNYDLPYPGLLPDSPFYFLRITRDRVVSFLISDSYKKSQFDLLQADKRLSAGIILSQAGKYKLADDVISKGENYLEQALEEAKSARKEGHPLGDLATNLYLSSQKHEEVLKDIISQNKGNSQRDFEQELVRAQKFQKIAKEILSQK